jgi:hypothetical protein
MAWRFESSPGHMLLILFYILEWLSILVLLAVLVLLFLWMWNLIKEKVPFFPVPYSTLKDIYKELHIKNDSVMYDLGCGDGRVLFYVSNFAPKAKYIGIENSQFPYMLSILRAWWERRIGREVEIRHQDFFQADLSDATHIFTYLYPNVMDDLLPKLDKELSHGTRLVSMTFKFTQKQPIKEVDLNRSKYKLARKLYIYEF